MGGSPEYKKDAERLGTLMAKNCIRLVYGGGSLGLMGVVAGAAKKAKGEVIGITTQHVINLQEPLLEGIEFEIKGGLSERKRRMFELSDAFCILPGGLGTLDELVEIMVMQQVHESSLPIYFLNTNGYWNIMGRVMGHMQREGFLSDLTQFNMHIMDTPEDIIKTYKSRFWTD
jgi:uncharacterized protein (TIGR00730 family)